MEQQTTDYSGIASASYRADGTGFRAVLNGRLNGWECVNLFNLQDYIFVTTRMRAQLNEHIYNWWE